TAASGKHDLAPVGVSDPIRRNRKQSAPTRPKFRRRISIGELEERLRAYVDDSGRFCGGTGEAVLSLSRRPGARFRLSQRRDGDFFVGSHSAARTQVDGGCSPFGTARTGHGACSDGHEPPVFCQGGRSRVGLLSFSWTHTVRPRSRLNPGASSLRFPYELLRRPLCAACSNNCYEPVPVEVLCE